MQLITAADILADRSVIPEAPGVYGWWFSGVLPGVPLDGTLQHGAYRLLYVGIAPQAPSKAGRISQSNLRKRICRNHLGNRIASSTLRRSLAALLREELSLSVWLNDAGKKTMSTADEAKLTNWMRSHAAISMLVTDRPWEVEHALLTEGAPSFPINIDGAAHGFREQMLALRAAQKCV